MLVLIKMSELHRLFIHHFCTGAANLPHSWFFNPNEQLLTNFDIKFFIGPTPLIWAIQGHFGLYSNNDRFSLKWHRGPNKSHIELKFGIRRPKYTSFWYMFLLLKNCRKWRFSYLGVISDDPQNEPYDALYFFSIFFVWSW